MRFSRVCLSFVLMCLLSLPALAGPTIIRDSRITDTGITPVLGRGYSIGTNTFQSTCMEDVVITKPSYDLTYTFSSIEAMQQRSAERRSSFSSSSSTTRTTSGSSTSSRNYWFSKRKSTSKYKNQLTQIYNRAGSSRVTTKGTQTSHIIEVNINLVSYYASVDEAQSKIGDNAAGLLVSKDIPGFFSSCGPYYVRSIGREATLLAFFEYTTESTERDMAFESSIENQIKGFRSRSRSSSSSSWWGAKKDSSESSDRTDFSNTYAAKAAQEFNETAEQRSLTITTFAFGVGKRKDAKIISYDIDSFKEAIQEAFMSMQDVRTGKVISMEVVPWVENTQFQNLIELEKKADRFEPVLDAQGQPVLNADGQPQQRTIPGKLLYEKKMLLNENAEFIIEIDRVDRNIMNMYYKARLCRRNIDMNWKSGGEIKEQYQDALLQNKRYIEQVLPLTELDQIVSQERVDEIYALHKTFMYGEDGDDANGGASACMKKIIDEGIFEISYREITECQPVIQSMGVIQNDTVENYCMPELAE